MRALRRCRPTPEHRPIAGSREEEAAVPKQESDIPEIQAQQLLARLFLCLDTGDHERLATLFQPNGVWVRRGKELVGAGEMVAALRDRSATLVGHHVVTNVVVEPGGEGRASVIAYLTVYRHDSGARRSGAVPLAGPAALAICRGEIARGEHGWRFSRLVVDPPTMSADVKS
jgi:ketosteroid isomerase-like protein